MNPNGVSRQCNLNFGGYPPGMLSILSGLPSKTPYLGEKNARLNICLPILHKLIISIISGRTTLCSRSGFDQGFQRGLESVGQKKFLATISNTPRFPMASRTHGLSELVKLLASWKKRISVSYGIHRGYQHFTAHLYTERHLPKRFVESTLAMNISSHFSGYWLMVLQSNMVYVLSASRLTWCI